MGSPDSKKRWPLGVLESPPLAVMSAGRQGHHPADRPHGWQSSGTRVPASGCLARRAQSKAHINISGVLGSLPWLFEHFLATKKGQAARLAPQPHGRGKAGQPRDGSSAVHTGSRLPAGNLHPKGGRQRPGPTQALERALRPARVRPPAGSLTPVGSASMAHGEQGAEEALRGHKAPHLCTRCPLGSMGSLSRRARARF